jgi:hypothetical protein
MKGLTPTVESHGFTDNDWVACVTLLKQDWHKVQGLRRSDLIGQRESACEFVHSPVVVNFHTTVRRAHPFLKKPPPHQML